MSIREQLEAEMDKLEAQETEERENARYKECNKNFNSDSDNSDNTAGSD